MVRIIPPQQEQDRMKEVLIVDDEADILKLVSENLVIRGYKVMVAKNGKEALIHLHASRPALMVLDIKLPDFSGWELLKRIKTDPQFANEFPVLVMTASVTDTNIELGAYPNVIEILIKPFNIANLVRIVKRIVGN